MSSIKNFKEKINASQKEISIIGIVNLGEEFDFNDYTEELSNFLNSNSDAKLNILYEYDDLLFSYSLSTDTVHSGADRISYDDLKFRSTLISKFKEKLLKQNLKTKDDIANRITIKQMYLPIHLNIIKFDSEIYIRPSLDNIGSIQDYKMIEKNDFWFSQINDYVTNYFDTKRGGKYSAYIDEEVLELYDQKKIPRGTYPRKSFYNTDYNQYVVWAFVFNRKGEILIHKRKENAKDNRGMWDKSVGGHVDFTKELSSDKTAIRELAEELFGDENKAQKSSLLRPDEENAIFLGDWRPDQRGFHPIEEIKTFKNTEWGYFRIPLQLKIDTPRMIPAELGGGEKKLKVIVDAYIFIAIDDFNIDDLKNSDYKLISMSQLKTAVDTKAFGDEKFEPTPDLKTIMTGELRQILTAASKQISYTFK